MQNHSVITFTLCNFQKQYYSAHTKCIDMIEISGLKVKRRRKDSSSYARQKDANAHVILPGAHRSARHVHRTFDTCFTLSLIYNLYVLFV